MFKRIEWGPKSKYDKKEYRLYFYTLKGHDKEHLPIERCVSLASEAPGKEEGGDTETVPLQLEKDHPPRRMNSPPKLQDLSHQLVKSPTAENH